MSLPRERFEYSAIIDRKPLKLPKGARVVVWTIVNVEEWNIKGRMPRTVLPPPGEANVIPDVPNWAWHEYGMRVGFWRLKAVLDKYRIGATMALNASVCRSYPRVAQSALEASWEIMGHGYTQKAMNLVQDERDIIQKSVATIREITGKKPRGWLSPGLTETWDTLDFLAEEGIEYVCDWVTDDQPHEIKTKAQPLVMIPYSLEVNDIPIMIIQHHKGEELFNRARDQFDRLYAEGRKTARVMAIAVHPFISGVPHRIRYFEQIYAYMQKKPGVLFWKGEEILDWYRSVKDV